MPLCNTNTHTHTFVYLFAAQYCALIIPCTSPSHWNFQQVTNTFHTAGTTQKLQTMRIVQTLAS